MTPNMNEGALRDVATNQLYYYPSIAATNAHQRIFGLARDLSSTTDCLGTFHS